MLLKPNNTIRLLNSQQSDREFAAGEIVLNSKPSAIFVELTQGCNLRCNMCRATTIPTKGNSMTSALFDRIAEELFPTAELVDLRGWGESGILPEICDRIETVLRYGARLRLVTNLSFRNDKLMDALLLANAFVDVSLDAVDPLILKATRTGSNLQLISQNLKKLTHNGERHENCTLLVTVQRSNIFELPQIIEFAASHGVRSVRLFSVTAEPGSPIGIEHYVEEELRASIARASKRASELGVTLTAGSRLGSMPGISALQSTCIHPWKYCNISFDGKVGFCDHLIGPGNEEFFVGSLSENTFAELWNCPALTALRQEHLGARSPDAAKFGHCAWCYKNKFVDFEYLLAPSLERYVVEL